MSANSKIEWTEETWNPIVGCSIVSPGCTNCYAMRQAARIEKMLPTERRGGAVLPNHYSALTTPSKAGPVWTGRVTLAPERTLTRPLGRQKPTTYFVNSMGDLFHESIPDEWIDRVCAVMALCPQHVFQILTKRAERMRDYVSTRAGDYQVILPEHACALSGSPCAAHVEDVAWPLPNVWLGVSAERQQEADERIPHLLATPAAVRFASCEPLLGTIDLTRFFHAPINFARALHWVIVGGESGPKARPMHPDWARSIRDQCAAAGVPFFFKQWGAWAPHKVLPGGDLGADVRADRVRTVHPSGRSPVEISAATGGRSTEPGSRYMARIGKARAGMLDGREHTDMPEGAR